MEIGRRSMFSLLFAPLLKRFRKPTFRDLAIPHAGIHVDGVANFDQAVRIANTYTAEQFNYRDSEAALKGRAVANRIDSRIEPPRRLFSW